MNRLDLIFASVVTGLATVFAVSSVSNVDAQTSVGTGEFRNTAAIDSQLKRGVSSKADVQRVLGAPNGSGGAMLPALGKDTQEVWYYEEIEMTGSRAEQSTLKLQIRQQILLVFFNGEVFDGYLWTSNAGAGTAR